MFVEENIFKQDKRVEKISYAEDLIQLQVSKDKQAQEAFCKARLNKLDEKVKELRCSRTHKLMHQPVQLEDEKLCDKEALKPDEPIRKLNRIKSQIESFIKEALVVAAKCMEHDSEVERAVSLSAECLSALRADKHYSAFISVFSALKTRELAMRLLEQLRAVRPCQLMELLVRVVKIKSQFATTVQLIEAIPAAMLVTSRNEVIELIRVEEPRSHSSEMRAELLGEMLTLKINEGDFDELRNDSVYAGKLSEICCKPGSISEAEFPDTSQVLFDINLQLADLFSSKQSNKLALKHYQQCLKLKIYNQRVLFADIHFKQGVLFMDEGNLDEAASSLKVSLTYNQTHNEKVYTKICEVFQMKKDQLRRQLGCELNDEFFMGILQKRVESYLRKLDIKEVCLDITAYLVESKSEKEFFELIKINPQMKERVYTKLADIYIELVSCFIYMKDPENASNSYALTLSNEVFEAWETKRSYALKGKKLMAWYSMISDTTSFSTKRDANIERKFLEYLELMNVLGINNQEEIANSYFVLAEYFSFRSKLSEAAEYFNKCYQIRSETKADLRDVCLARSRLYDQQQENEKSEYFYKQCIEISEEFSRESKEVAEDCFNLGCFLLKCNRLEEAESYLAKSLNIRETKFAKDFSELFQTNLKLAELYSLHKDERVYQHYKKCRELKSLNAGQFEMSCCKDQWDTNIEHCYKFYNDLILKFKGARLNAEDKQELTTTNFILGELFEFRFNKLKRLKEYGKVTQECKTSFIKATTYYSDCQKLREKYFSAKLKDILIIKCKLANLFRQSGKDRNKVIQIYEQLIAENEGIYFAEVVKAYYYLGKLHFSKYAYVKAVQVMEQCIELAENDYPNPSLLTKACYIMGSFYKQLGETKWTMGNAKMHAFLKECGVVVKNEDILEQSIKTKVIYCLREQALEFKLDEDTDYEHELRYAGRYFEKYLLTAAQTKRKCYDELYAVYFQLGNLLILKGSYREAKRPYLKCLENRFTNTRDMSRADTLLCCCSYLMGDSHDIHDNFYSEFLRNAVEQSKPSERADAFFTLGNCLYSRGVLDAAEDCYLKCLHIWSEGRQEITLDPNLFKLYSSLGVLYHAKGDLAKSDEYFELRGRRRLRKKEVRR
jgi:TolA-binding protein